MCFCVSDCVVAVSPAYGMRRGVFHDQNDRLVAVHLQGVCIQVHSAKTSHRWSYVPDCLNHYTGQESPTPLAGGSSPTSGLSCVLAVEQTASALLRQGNQMLASCCGFFCILYNLIVYSYFIYLTVYACSVYLTVYGKCWGRGREAAPPLCREEHSESGPLAEAAAASQGERYPWPKASCGYGWSSAMVAFAQVTGGASPRVWTPMDLRLGPPAFLRTSGLSHNCTTSSFQI